MQPCVYAMQNNKRVKHKFEDSPISFRLLPGLQFIVLQFFTNLSTFCRHKFGNFTDVNLQKDGTKNARNIGATR